MEKIKNEILAAISKPENYLGLNFRVPKKLIEQYGSELFFKILEEMEEEELIFWEKINPHTTVIKRTNKSFQKV